MTLSAGVTSAAISVLPLTDAWAEGDETVVLSLQTNASVYAIGAPAGATVTIRDAPMDAWRVSHFAGNANIPAVAGDLADPDGDGLVNLVEYALGLDPNVAGAQGLPAAASDGDYLTLTYRRPKSATDITYIVEAAGQAEGPWSTAGVTEIGRVDHGTYWMITMRDAVPSAGADRRFMRLRITRP
jgi:hypothetical protein